MLGWTVLGTATLHVLFYVPLLAPQPWPRALAEPVSVTGAGAWMILAGLVGLGLRIAAKRRPRRGARMPTIHFVAAASLLVVTLIPVGPKLGMR